MMVTACIAVSLFLVFGAAVLVLRAAALVLDLDGPSNIELHGQPATADFTFFCKAADKCKITKCAVSVAEPIPDPYNIDVSACSCSGGPECKGGCQVIFPAGIYETYIFKLNGEDSCGNKGEDLLEVKPVDTTCILEKIEGPWEDFCDLLGQKRRTITLINADCTQTSGREVIACDTMRAPSIGNLIFRYGIDGEPGDPAGYWDLFVEQPSIPHTIEASFGPLSSVMVVQGHYFYNFTQFPATGEQDLDMRTFTEAWMGQIPWGGNMTAVKTAGVGLCNMSSCSDNGPVNFSAGPWLAPPNDIVVPFYSDPFCNNHINSKDCVMYPMVRGLVPECTKDLQLKTVVNSKTYVIDLNPVPPEWHIISERFEFPGGSGVFVVVPSTTYKESGQYPFVMRGTRYSMNRANRLVLGRFSDYLGQIIGAYKFRAPVGFPMSFTTEYDYEEDSFPGSQWVPGEYVRTPEGYPIKRYCDLVNLGNPPNLDEKVCSRINKDQEHANCFCGFGRRRYPDDYTQEFTKVKFFNGGYDSQAGDFFRPEKEVDLFEVGKPFKPFKIFPLVPFLDENVKSGCHSSGSCKSGGLVGCPTPSAVVRVYMCGETNGVDIGFIESAINNDACDDSDIDYLKDQEWFELLYEPFNVSRFSPFWGYPEPELAEPLSSSTSSTVFPTYPWLNTAAAAIYTPALSIAAKNSQPLKIIKPKPASPVLLELKKLKDPYVKGEILVRFKQSAECGAECGKANKAAIDKLLGGRKTIKSKIGLLKVKLFPKDDFNQVLDKFQQSDLVESASPNYLLFIEDQPNDPGFPSLWGLHNTGQTGGTDDADIDALEAWDLEDGNSSEVVVAVLDTGVDYTHPDLADNIWLNKDEIPDNGIDDDNNGFIDDVRGWNFSDSGAPNDPMDDHYHGTHVAGIIGAIGNNNQGIIGVNTNVKIMTVKFMNKDGAGTWFDATQSVVYATDNGARVINASFGGYKRYPELLRAIQDFQEQDGLFIAAAGNESNNNDFKPLYPASFEADNIIAVAASDYNDKLAGFSNTGVMGVDLAAPGVGILSTMPSNAYAYLDGTSMATPHVSGAAALFWSAYPTWTYNQVKRILLENADVKTSLRDKVHSSGRLNIYNALKFVLEQKPPLESQTARDPLIWGYNLNPISGKLIQAKIDTWQGEKSVKILPEGKSVAAIKFLDDDLHPSYTALADLKKVCREGYCTRLHQDIVKVPYHPVEFGAPQIEDVTSLENWQAKPFPISEDVPYAENFCVGAQAVIEAEDSSRGFGDDPGAVWLWQDKDWGQVSIVDWSNERVTVKIESSYFGKSADCALEPKTLADISNFKPPAKVCDTAGVCRVSDQKLIRIIPPQRARLIEPSAPEQDKYCMNDRILILGSGFGEERLGARITIRGEEAARYIKWSDAEIIITPPERYSMWRSPFCPRTDEQNKHGLLVRVEEDDPVTIICPGLPSGPRDCVINEIKLVAPYEFEPIPVYHRNPEYAYFTNICLKDEIEINASFNAGDERGNNIVEFWSNEDGWYEASSYLEWSNNKIKIMPPQVSAGRTSQNCPRQNSRSGEVSIFKGPLRVRVGGEHYYIGLDDTNVGNKIAMHKEVLVNKNYLVDEEVKISGRFFSEIRSESEFDKISLSNPLDRRNTGYVEFYTDDLGWAPAGEYIKWSDNEIIVKPPKISIEEEWEWEDKATVTLTVIGDGQGVSGRAPVDLVFALDSSGSMCWTDPCQLRKKATVAMMGMWYDDDPAADPPEIPADSCKSEYPTQCGRDQKCNCPFPQPDIDPLDPHLESSMDYVGVVSWASFINFQYSLSDNFIKVRKKLWEVKSSLGTNLLLALSTSIDLIDSFLRDHTDRKQAVQVILFLTDGRDNTMEGPDCESRRANIIAEAEKARDKGYIIFTIGVGTTGPPSCDNYDNYTYDEDLLIEIAETTGGTFCGASSGKNLQQELQECFEKIVGQIIRPIVAEDIVVTDVLQPYIRLYEPPNFTIPPTTIEYPEDTTDGTTVLTWNPDPDRLRKGDEWSVSFDVSSDQAGYGVEVNVYDLSKVEYIRTINNIPESASTNFPHLEIDVRDPKTGEVACGRGPNLNSASVVAAEDPNLPHLDTEKSAIPTCILKKGTTEEPGDVGRAAISIAKQPVRVCTKYGCSTNIVNFRKPEITETKDLGACIDINGFNFGEEKESGLGRVVYRTFESGSVTSAFSKFSSIIFSAASYVRDTLLPFTTSSSQPSSLKIAKELSPVKKLQSAYIPDEVVIKFKTKIDASRVKQFLADKQIIRSTARYTRIKLSKGQDLNQALVEYKKNKIIQFAEPNYLLSIDYIPNDTLFPYLWGLNNTGPAGGVSDADIDAPEAWDIEDGKTNKTIAAVIDTGVDYTHPDLADNIWINEDEIPDNGIDDDNNGYIDDVRGWDACTCAQEGQNNECLIPKLPDNDPMDEHWMSHGTLVAGTLGAVGNNNQGVIGVNPNVKIMPIKIACEGGGLFMTDTVDAIDYAITNKAKVINASFRLLYYSDILFTAVEDSHKANILFVAAAGNDYMDIDVWPVYPASYPLPNIIAVAASTRGDQKPDFSNYGAKTVHLAAPGVDLISTMSPTHSAQGFAYGYASGTSIAAPYVVGAASILLSAHPEWTNLQVKNVILKTVDVKDSLKGLVSTSGRLNLCRALGGCGGGPPPSMCGDGKCDSDESCSTCAVDCGECPSPPGNWWKNALIPADPDNPDQHLWKDNQVRACFQAGDSADIILLCRADEKCVYWDLSTKQEINWHYPETFAISPLCVDIDASGGKLVTLYGQDLERDILKEEHIIELDDEKRTRIKAKIYDDPIKLFKQQYQDRLVLVIPESEISKIKLPKPGGRYQREHQAVIGKIFLQTKFAQKEEIEITSALTLSYFCNQETDFIDSPVILETNEKSYVDEDRDKGKGRAAGSGDNIVTTTEIKGCNLILDQGTQILFGDILQYRDLAPIADWDRDKGLGRIEISTPFGAKSGLLSVNVWTGLLEYPGIWLTEESRINQALQPRKTLTFNVLPTVDELGARLGVSGQISEIYGSDFCGALGCGDFLKDVYLGVWQKQDSTDFDLKGAPAKFFDVSPRMVRIKTPREYDFKTYGDMNANMDKMAVSGQPYLKRGDDIGAVPIIKADQLNAEEFFAERQYFTKTPVLKEVLPSEISLEEQKKNSPYFKGADYYGYDNTPEQLVFRTPYREFTYIPHGEFAFDEPYDVRDVDIYERWQYPDLLDLERDSYKRVPEHLFSFSESNRQPYLNNPQGVILSNWDGTFTAWLEGIYKDPAKRPAYSIKSAKEQQCTVRRSLSLPSGSDLPALYQKGDLGIYKIDPLPLLDVCYYCQDQEITIIGQDYANFGDDKGKVYFWSDEGWIEVEIVSWEHKIDEKDIVKVRLEEAQDIKHNQCSGSKNLTKVRLPLKFCRAGTEEQCIVWYGPNTHVKLGFESGSVNQGNKRTLGRFNRLNLAPSSVFGGDNLAEQIFIQEGTDEGCKISVNIPILDSAGAGVKEANVFGAWSGDYSADVSGITNDQGIASFQTSTVGCHGTFIFTVTGAAKDNWLYDPNSNIETSDSITLP